MPSRNVSVGNVSVSVSEGNVSSGRGSKTTKVDLSVLAIGLQLEGKRVTVETDAALIARGLEKAEGIIQASGKIRTSTKSGAALNRDVTVSAFAKIGGANSNAWDCVFVADVPNKSKLFPGGGLQFSLRELWDKFVEMGGSHREVLQNALKNLDIVHVGDLKRWNATLCESQQVDVAYRVLRPDESISEGITFAPSAGGAYSDAGLAVPLVGNINEHIGKGTRSKAQKPIISATAAPEIALWWSAFGLQKIARINLRKAREANVAQWHVGIPPPHGHSELLYPQQKGFAAASHEIVFTDKLPANVVEEYPIKWSVVTCLRGSDTAIGTFPGAKELHLDNFELKEVLYLPSYLPAYLPACLSIYLSIHPPTHPSIYRSIDPSIHRSIDPSIHLSIHLSI